MTNRSDMWNQNGGDLVAAAQSIDARGESGALLTFIVAAPSGRTTDAAPLRLQAAWDCVLSGLPKEVVARRFGWNMFEAVLIGERAALVEQLRGLLLALRSHPAFAGAEAQVVLTRLFSGEVERTFRCDPDYDLRSLTGDYLVWVEPYDRDDWKESQWYPTTDVCWHERRQSRDG